MNDVAEMLTAKDIQDLLQIDRSTVYRLAEAGRLLAIKVGRQWRFPADQFDNWLKAHISTRPPGANEVLLTRPVTVRQTWNLEELLSWDWLKIVQETFAQ